MLGNSIDIPVLSFVKTSRYEPSMKHAKNNKAIRSLNIVNFCWLSERKIFLGFFFASNKKDFSSLAYFVITEMTSPENNFVRDEIIRSDRTTIVGAWLESKVRIRAYDEKLCKQVGVSYYDLLERQRRDFSTFVYKLTPFQCSKYTGEIVASATNPLNNHYLNMNVSLDSFSDPVFSLVAKAPPEVPREELLSKLSLVFEEIMGESYHAELLVDMFQIKNYRHLANVRFIDIMHTEVLDLVKIRELLTVFKIMSSTRLRNIMSKLLRPYDGPVLSMLGFKHDAGCSFRVLPKDIMIKIAHCAAGTNPVGKFLA